MRPQNLLLVFLLILAISVAAPACSSSSSTDETPAIGGPGEETPVFGSPTPPTLLFTPLPPGYAETAIPPTLQSKTPSAKPQQTPTPVPKASATKPPSPTPKAAITPNNAATPAAKTPQTLGIIIKDGNISMSSSSLQTGKVQVSVQNGGVDSHGIAIKGPGVDTRTDSIDPGKTVNKEITISQTGAFELFCPVDGHRQKGESVTIQVSN